MLLSRQILTANTDTDFEFGEYGYSFLVKNFTTDYITVKFGCCEETIKIPSNCGQVITSNVNNTQCTNKLTINATAGGEVEAQCIEY